MQNSLDHFTEKIRAAAQPARLLAARGRKTFRNFT
jgi:hypothetical protein